MSDPASTATLSRLALPLLLNSMLGLITNLADTYIISAYSKSAAAAVSLANQILVVAYDLSVLLGVGATILIARSLGKQNRADSQHIARFAIVSNTVLGVVIGLVMYLFAPILVRLLNTPAEVFDDTLRYIEIISIAIPFNGFLMASVSCLRGFSLTRAIFLLGIFAFPSYLLLDYILVLGAGPIPALGVTGSALATLLVRVGSVLVLVFVLPSLIGLSWRGLRSLIRERALLTKLIQLSSPSVLDNVAYGFYQLVLVSFIAGLGVVAVVSRFYALALSACLAVIVMAISQANEVLVGYRQGEESYSRMKRQVWQSGVYSILLASLCAAILYWFSPPLVALFTEDAEVIALTGHLLLLTIFIQPLTGLNTVLFHSLKVLGDVRTPVIFSQVVMWLMAIPLAYWLVSVKGYGVAGLWYAMMVEEFAKTLFMIIRWKKCSGKFNPAICM